MATIQKKNQIQNTQDFIRIQDLLYLCLAKWHWFVISLTLCLGAAAAYLLSTPPVYTRIASILIKDDSQSNSSSTESEALADLGLVIVNTNVNNEILTLQSPDLMLEVVSRLNLAMRYYVKDKFYKRLLYGKDLPVQVFLIDLPNNETADFTLRLEANRRYTLSDLSHNDENIDQTIRGTLGDTIQTPYGRLTVTPTHSYNPALCYDEVFVSRTTIIDALGGACARLGISKSEEVSNIVTLWYDDVSTQRADDILSTLIEVYKENWVSDRNRMAVSTLEFINDRLGVIEKELGEVDDDISSFKSKNLLPDVQSVASMYLSQAHGADMAIQGLNDRLYMARYLRSYLADDANLHQPLPVSAGVSDLNISSQIDKYNTTLFERNSLASKSSPRNPLVIEADSVLTSMRKSMITSVDNLLVSLEGQVRSQKTFNRDAVSQIASSPEQAKYLLSVERQQKVKESLYLYLLQKREKTELSKAFAAYNTRIISRPNGSISPSYPSRRKILLVAFALGLLAPVIIIFIRENTNTVVRGRKDLDDLTVPIVGEIPQYFSHRKKWLIRRKVKPDTKAIVVREGSRNIINEAFRVLRSNMDFMMASQKDHNVFIFTSFNPGSGKSFLTLNIAISFAIKQKRVLVIDGDLRHGTASSYIDSPESGLSDYLSGMTDDWRQLIVRSPQQDNMYIFPIGKVPPNPTELLENGKLQGLIEQLRTEYDYIFIDCPPIDIVADAQILEKVADRTLFVIRAGLLDRSMLPELETIYQDKRFKNLSVILNGTEGTGGRYSYRYGYRYGYHYGYTSYHGA